MMNLKKDKWEKINLGKVFKLKSGNALPNAKIIGGIYEVYGGNGIIGYHNTYMVKEPTIIIGRVGEYCGSVHISKPNSWITDNGLYPTEYFKRVEIHFLKYLLEHSNLNRYAQKTGQPSISQTSLYQIVIPLPPMKEQRRIADLFQSIEQSIAHAEAQEGNLKALQKSLCNGLLDNPPVFGNLLSEENCTSCKFGDTADCIEQHDKKPMENGITRFIGLENIEPENFNLQGFGNIENGTTFTKRFAKGDVLFGKRRAYLKKVAVADFDGICSGDILVLRAKRGNMLTDLLPYYISSEAFIKHAVSTSAGSLSPRTKWRDLSGFELSIPDIKTQEKIVEVFNQLRMTLIQLKAQIQTLRNLKQKLLNEILG